ncbi:MAG: hypothetical protein ACK5O1_03395 [Holosporales bacterium]|jgi:hypothetical protein
MKIKNNPNRAPNLKKSWTGKVKFLYGLIVLCMSLISLSGVLLCTIGMLPGLVAWSWDKNPNKRIALSVIIMNAAGIAPTLIRVLPLGWSLAAGFEILNDAREWLGILSAAGVGWGIIIVTPQIIRTILIWHHQSGIKYNVGLQKKLIESWGEKISVSDPIKKRETMSVQRVER